MDILISQRGWSAKRMPLHSSPPTIVYFLLYNFLVTRLIFIKFCDFLYNLSGSNILKLFFKIQTSFSSTSSVFQQFFASIKKFLILQGDWALGYHSTEFRPSLDISLFPKVLSLVRQFVYTMLISNNCASFHLC